MAEKKTLTDTVVKGLRPREKPYEMRDAKLGGFLLRVQPTGRMSYYVQYDRAKRVLIGRADVLKPAEARAKAKEILGDVAKGLDPLADKRKAKVHTLESYLLNEYAPWVNAHHRNGEATIKLLKAQFFPAFGKCSLDEIMPLQIEKWRSVGLKAGAKPSSLNRYLNSLKAALARAVDWDMIKENPLARVKMLPADNQPTARFLSDDEEGRLRAALGDREARIIAKRASANSWRQERGYELLSDFEGRYADHIKPLVLLSINTGLRRGELFNLKRADVDLDRGTITVTGTTSKTGQTRHVSLNSEAAKVLSGWMAQSEGSLVFPSKNGDRLNNVSSAWRNLIKDAGITGFRWHDMRHHFASRLVMTGVDLNTVRELLGHSDIKMTLRYAHLAPAVKAAAVEKIVRRNAPDGET